MKITDEAIRLKVVELASEKRRRAAESDPEYLHPTKRWRVYHYYLSGGGWKDFDSFWAAWWYAFRNGDITYGIRDAQSEKWRTGICFLCPG